MGWIWGKKAERDTAPQEAIKESQARLQAAQAQSTEIRVEAAKLRKLRQKNHFGALVQGTWSRVR